jgi:hypothetical protein
MDDGAILARRTLVFDYLAGNRVCAKPAARSLQFNDAPTEPIMIFQPSTFLRRVLLLDAAASGITGLQMLAGASLLVPLLNIPVPLMRYAGLVLIPYALFVAWAGTRTSLSSATVWSIIAINALWVAGSVLLLVSGTIAPTWLGYGFVIAQAVVVGVFAELQYFGLKRQQAAA